MAMTCALAIGGLDPGGGAGIAADLRALSAAGAFGCAAVALVTVQSTAGVERVRAVDAGELAAQIDEVMAHQRVGAIKVGALGSAGNVRVVAERARRARDAAAVVVDTPMLPTRGKARLLDTRALRALRDELLPHATLVTANAHEAATLLGEPVRTVSEAHDAARALARTGARAVLVKGGHLDGAGAVDVLAIGGQVVELRARRLRIAPTHGTGCTFASLVAGRLAATKRAQLADAAIVAAVRWAKRIHHAALARAMRVGRGMRVIVF